MRPFPMTILVEWADDRLRESQPLCHFLWLFWRWATLLRTNDTDQIRFERYSVHRMIENLSYAYAFAYAFTFFYKLVVAWDSFKESFKAYLNDIRSKKVDVFVWGNPISLRRTGVFTMRKRVFGWKAETFPQKKWSNTNKCEMFCLPFLALP